MRNTYILSLLLFAFFAQGQNPKLSQDYDTGFYIFNLTDQQADTLFRIGMFEIKDYYFDNPMKIFESYEAFQSFDKSTLPLGHYLIAKPIENKLNLSLYSSNNCTMSIIDNKTDLILQFHDKSQNLLLNNTVHVKKKKLPFDKRTKAYRLTKSKWQGLVTIDHKGHKNYFKVEETINNSRWAYLMTKPFFRSITFPFIRLRYSSKNLYRAISNRNLSQYIRWTNRSIQYKLQNAKNRICPEERIRSSYATFSKPKFKTGDTLKFNAFLLDRKNHYYVDSISVFLQGYGIDKELKSKTKFLTKIVADAPGSYNYEMIIGKDIQLLLDRSYTLILKTKSNQFIISQKFRHEQYDLNALRLKILNANTVHNRWEDFEWSISTLDENQLPILDGKLHLECKLVNARAFLDTEVFIPFKLLDTMVNTDPSGTTTFQLDSNLFPLANFYYEFIVKLENEEGKEIIKRKTFNYQSRDEKLNFHVSKDSIELNFLLKGKEIIANGNSSIHFPMSIKSRSFSTDQSFPIDPLVDYYKFKINEKIYTLDLKDYPHLIEFEHKIDTDSLRIVSSNPRNIPFSYFLYQDNKEIARGYGTALDLTKVNPRNHNFTLMVQYKWGSKISNQNFVFTNHKNKLNIEIHHQDHIYPGELVDIKIKATDFKGQSVPSLTLLAHSQTDKFETKPIIVRPFKEKKKNKNILREYRKSQLQKNSQYLFDYEQWNEIASLDSIEFYRLLYPGNSIYRNYLPVEDSITQVIPFIFNNGHTESPQIVYIDFQPVYFAWSNQVNPYSFELSPGRHLIKIRTQYHEIEFPSIEIKKGVKNIISIDISKYTKKNRIASKKNHLSQKEKSLIYPRIALLDRSTNYNNKSFVSNKDTSSFQVLSTSHQNILIGPLLSKKTIFHDGESYSIPFSLEANYRYFFGPQLVKMKSLNLHQGYPIEYPTLLNYTFHKNILAKVYTKTQFEKNIEKRTNRYILNHFINKTKSRNRIGKNTLRLNYNAKTQIVNTLLYNLEFGGNIEVFQGQKNNFQKLSAGMYGVIFFNNLGQAIMYDSLFVLSDGISYYDLALEKSIIQDSLGNQMHQIIFDLYDSKMKDRAKIDSFKTKLRLEVDELIRYKGPINNLYGQIIDLDGNPVIGAAVIAKYSNRGVSTDVDGKFKISIPLEGDDIQISYIGFETLYKTVGMEDNFVTWMMNEGPTTLSEITISAYKVPLIDFDQTSSVSTVNSESIANSPIKSANVLAGKLAGVSINDGNIRIRGSRSNATNYYVDGIRVSNQSLLPKAESIMSIQHITGAQAKDIYGSTEVFLITTNQELEANRGSSLRNNFSDVGFWKPNIVTDKNGEAIIKVTFPDDITKWNLHFYAVSNTEKYGQKTTFIRSYKPLSASLKTPKFLIEGDHSKLVTKVQNYRSDSSYVESKFSINDSTIKSNKHWVKSIKIDSLEVYAQGLDTIRSKFSIETETAYFDGEQHEIPVLPQGMLKTEGFFTLLKSGEKWKVNTDTFKSEVTIHVESNHLQLIRNQINHIKNYEHLCNEQLASKLLALLIDKKYSLLLNEEFLYEDMIVEIIVRLKKRYSPKTLWGWWSEEDYIPWISTHVTKALLLAKKMNYNINIPFEDNLYFLSSQFTNASSATKSLNILDMMSALNSDLNIEKYVNEITNFPNQTFRDSLRIALLKIQLNQKVDLSFMTKHMNSSMLGEHFINYRGLPIYYNISNNNAMYTLLAYKILQAVDEDQYKLQLEGMKLYLMGRRINGYYRNTYEGISIIDLLSEGDIQDSVLLNMKPSLIISGAKNDTITDFPFELKVEKGTNISLHNTALGSMFFTTYSKYWEEDIQKHEKEFMIETKIDHSTADTINVRKKEQVNLITTVTCKKMANYTMIEIPIPAGASYYKKGRRNSYEVHREYYNHKVLIFCKTLPIGKHHFNIELKTNYGGTYTINPAKVELMYFPTFYANTALKKMLIH